jgi:sulfide:quinone oxidoreductase
METVDVLIAGGGIAGLEAALALSDMAPGARIRMLADRTEFAFTPLAVALPFDPALRATAPLAELLRGSGVELEAGALGRVEAQRHVAVTAAGRELGYRHLLVAVGARAVHYLGRRALTFADAASAPALRRLLDEVCAAAAEGMRVSLAVVVPPGPGWPLPAYELALLIAREVRGADLAERVGLTLVTAERAALGLFGPVASAAMADDLARAGVELRAGAPVRGFGPDGLELIPAGSVPAHRVLALPSLRGPRVAGLPADALGFVRADEDGRVAGADGVWVAGDAGPFAVKQGGIACAQADTVASLVAGALGAQVAPIPFDPTLRAFVLEGAKHRPLRGRPTGGHEDTAGVPSPLATRPAAGKVAGRYLAPRLEERLRVVASP